MEVITDIDSIKHDPKSAVTVGTFDGIHLGHRKIIETLNKIKEEKGLRSIVITFDPHPQIVLRNKARDIKLLTTTQEKIEFFKSLGVDIIYVINFTQEFSKTPAVDFYVNFLIKKIGLSDLILGYDHMFGRNREGNFETLKELASQYNFTVDKVSEFTVNGEHISSTEIRNALLEGNVKKANRLLGRNYSIDGTIIHGDKRGREFGYPTANIKPDSEFKLIPKTGVYAVNTVLDGKEYAGMMNIGYNPTVTDKGELRVEVNLFDFDRQAYGEKIKIQFIDFIRDEMKFNSIDDLITEMNSDKEKTLSILK